MEIVYDKSNLIIRSLCFMKMNVKKVLTSLLVASIIGIGTSTVSAASFGNSVSGASTVESFQIKYNGAAWNYKNSPYKSTSFRYKREFFLGGVEVVNKEG